MESKMNTIKVISNGDGTGMEVNPFVEIEISGQFNPKINIDWEQFEAEHPPPLLLNNEPFMEKGVVVEPEKVWQYQYGTGKWNNIEGTGTSVTDWKASHAETRQVYQIITAPEKEDATERTAKFLIDGFAEPVKPTVEEMMHDLAHDYSVVHSDTTCSNYAVIYSGFISGYTTAEATIKKKVLELDSLIENYTRLLNSYGSPELTEKELLQAVIGDLIEFKNQIEKL